MSSQDGSHDDTTAAQPAMDQQPVRTAASVMNFTGVSGNRFQRIRVVSVSRCSSQSRQTPPSVVGLNHGSVISVPGSRVQGFGVEAVADGIVVLDHERRHAMSNVIVPPGTDIFMTPSRFGEPR